MEKTTQDEKRENLDQRGLFAGSKFYCVTTGRVCPVAIDEYHKNVLHQFGTHPTYWVNYEGQKYFLRWGYQYAKPVDDGYDVHQLTIHKNIGDYPYVGQWKEEGNPFYEDMDPHYVLFIAPGKGISVTPSSGDMADMPGLEGIWAELEENVNEKLYGPVEANLKFRE